MHLASLIDFNNCTPKKKTKKNFVLRQMKMINFFYLLLVFLFGTSKSFAQRDSTIEQEVERFEAVNLPHTQVRRIYSQFTKQNYRILISLPASYGRASGKKFPLLLTLDDDFSFALTKKITEHLSDRKYISENFVVSIAYDGPLNYRVNRTRDYTPTHVLTGGYGREFQRYSGGGPAFADFIEKELIPYLEKSFSLDQNRTIIGHSFGGLFASWMLVTRPQVFKQYIVVSPSLWYDNALVLKLEKQLATRLKDLNARVFFGIGEKETRKEGNVHDMVNDMKSFVSALEQRKYAHLKITSVIFPEENHSTVFPSALTRGLMSVLQN